MNCIQDFVREILNGYGFAGILIGVLVFVLVTLVLHILMCLDEEFRPQVNKRNIGILLVLCITAAIYILWRQKEVWYRTIIGFVMLVYLVLCSITDYYSEQVYDLIQLGVCVIVAGNSFLHRIPPTCGAELIVFAILQMLVFRRMYGEGDVMCFLICALSLVERGIFIWTCHMGVAFLLLGIVQGMKHNVAPNGNLRLPVPFFPYMAVAYVLVF